MVFKFLSRGKKSEYFLEAPPETQSDTNGSAPAAKVAEAKKAVGKTLAEAQKVAEAKVDQLQDAAAKVADAVEDKVAEVKEAAPKAVKAVEAKAPEAKTKKFKKTKTSEAAAKSEASAKPAPAKVKAEPVKNFATDFLMPDTMPRRRPGPSMDTFRNMAKDVTPRR